MTVYRMPLRSRNSRSMERGTDTSRPNRKEKRFCRVEACSAGGSRFNYALLRGRRVSEISVLKLEPQEILRTAQGKTAQGKRKVENDSTKPRQRLPPRQRGRRSGTCTL